jgi:hypothetical protein
MTVETATLHHRKAMELVDAAMLARLDGNSQGADVLTRQAFEEERQAARAAEVIDLEPTRSVLHRSAASLALQCSEFREAERLIAGGLIGNPPHEIAEELRDLLEQVYFQRHLSLRGADLAREELQLSLVGRTVGYGIVGAPEITSRVETFERLLHRTAERMMGLAYRESSLADKDVREAFELFVGVPRAASFAVTLHVSRPSRQPALPNIGPDFTPYTLLEEVVDGLRRINAGEVDAVRGAIPQDAYYRNFVALARKFAPDGREITTVGLTLIGDCARKEVALTKTRREIRPAPQPDITDEPVAVRGTLLFADERGQRKASIRLVTKDSQEERIIVREGLSDIVRPLWGEEVIVEGVRSRDGILLDDIRRVEAEDGSE